MELKKCPYCNKTVLAVSKFCKHCGKNFEQKEPIVEEKIDIEDNSKENSFTISRPEIDKQLNSVNSSQSNYFGLIAVVIAVVVIMILFFVTNKTTNITDEVTKVSSYTSIDKHSTFSQNSEQKEEKYLVTNNSVGLFKIGGTCLDIAKNDYNYDFIQRDGDLFNDACNNIGYDLGYNIVNDENGPKIKYPKITISGMLYEFAEDYNHKINSKKYENNPNLVYDSTSIYSNGWYWKDKIGSIIVLSHVFKTKEGIGVGTNINKVKELFGDFSIYSSWHIGNVFHFKIEAYPNLVFDIDGDDAIRGYEFYNQNGSPIDPSLSVSDFKENAKIKRILINDFEYEDR